MKKFAVLAEDRSDAETLVALVRRILGDERLSVAQKGFGGCGQLRNKAESHINRFRRDGCTHFLICHDADGVAPAEIRRRVRGSMSASIAWSEKTHGIIVPVQEIEAWMIADEKAVAAAIPSLSIPRVAHPETIRRPKEWLVDASRTGNSKPLYAPAIFNPKVARALDVDGVAGRCPSFRELVDFVRNA
jgi:hypothetical protein